ncbi:hypothetical protein HPB49_008750 [Dermacentor silvarum]|uniref:Uncharacterized protein n=1 Tax=Dermacentor silvarum TaxID=543639 RepID=A0ACB8DBS5_DERSI|nr:hypothetical protein HPB49_008750 [Dermacentor silvarum]
MGDRFVLLGIWVALFCLVAVATAAPLEDYPPQPYSFSYDTTDEYGTRLTREESGDANNNKVGSYSYTDAQGIARTVRYTADAEGFHATVETNEPGTKSSNPADALYTSSAVEVAPAPAAAVVAKPVLLCCVVAFAAAQQQPNVDGPPQPYSFSYDNTDEFGTRISQSETGDENNNKVGSYSYTDANGISRTVKYTADADGFHATVETNEPGTKSSNPADAQYISNAAEVAPAPVVAKPAQVVVKATPVVHTVHAAPVAVHAVHAAPTFALHAAPVALHHVTPVTLGAHPVAFHAPLTYTLGRAKSR